MKQENKATANIVHIQKFPDVEFCVYINTHANS